MPPVATVSPASSLARPLASASLTRLVSTLLSPAPAGRRSWNWLPSKDGKTRTDFAKRFAIAASDLDILGELYLY